MAPQSLAFRDARLSGISCRGPALAGPAHLELHVKEGCYNTCNLCWNHSPLLGNARMPAETAARELPFETALRVLDDFTRMGGERVLVSGGGEPVLRRDLPELIAAVKERNLECHLVTSVGPLGPETAARLVDAGLDLLIAGVWAGCAETYRATHPGMPAGLFERIENTLTEIGARRRAARSRRPWVCVSNVLSRSNANDVENMVAFGDRVGADFLELHIGDVLPGLTDREALTPGDARGVLGALERLAKSAGCLGMGARGVPGVSGALHSRSHEGDLFFARADVRGAGMAGLRFDPEDHFLKGNSRQVETFFLKDATAFRRRLREYIHARENPGDDPAAARRARLVDEIPCAIGYTYARVTTDSRAVPCCKAPALADLGEVSLKDAWRSPAWKEFRTKALLLPKSDPYFAPMACRESCDNISQNMETARALEEFSGSPRSSFMGDGELREDTKHEEGKHGARRRGKHGDTEARRFHGEEGRRRKRGQD